MKEGSRILITVRLPYITFEGVQFWTLRHKEVEGGLMVPETTGVFNVG